MAAHDGKQVIETRNEANLIALAMECRHGRLFESYSCERGDAGLHWHVGTSLEGKWVLEDWTSEMPRRSEWL